MILTRWNCWVGVSGSPKELEWVKDKLTFSTGTDRFGNPQYDCLLLSSRPIFPAGWILPLVEHARRAGLTCIIRDERRKPCEPDPLQRLEWFYGYQHRAIEAVIRAGGQGIVDMGVGGGKGELLAALPLKFPCRWGIFVQEASLVTMLVERYRKRAPSNSDPNDAGMIWRGAWQPGRRLTVVSVQTLAGEWQEDRKAWSPRAKAFLDGLHGIIGEECHGSAANHVTKQLRSCQNAYFRVGVSATVTGRSDHRDHVTQGHFGPVVFKITGRELEALGKVATGQVVMRRVDQPDTPPYQEGGREVAIIKSRIRNQAVIEMVREFPKPCLVFIHETDHGERLLELVRAAGWRAEFVWGDTPTKIRTEVIRRVEIGALDVVVASNAWKQGVDIIHLRSGLNAAGGMSVILTEQRRGRPVRVCHTVGCPTCAKFGAKRSMIWGDFYDSDSAHRGREPHWLARHSEARRKAYEEKGQMVTLR